MYIESRLREKIGMQGKLHTGRSRNDQVALDMHLYMKKEIKAIDFLLYELQKTIIDLAAEHTGTLMPGYTHLQRAQPVRFAHHLLAYFWMFQRDRERLRGAYRRADIMSLGAGAWRAAVSRWTGPGWPSGSGLHSFTRTAWMPSVIAITCLNSFPLPRYVSCT